MGLEIKIEALKCDVCGKKIEHPWLFTSGEHFNYVKYDEWDAYQHTTVEEKYCCSLNCILNAIDRCGSPVGIKINLDHGALEALKKYITMKS